MLPATHEINSCFLATFQLAQNIVDDAVLDEGFESVRNFHAGSLPYTAHFPDTDDD
jgi:hypothetical protein